MANQVDFKILPSDQFNVYSPQTRSDKIITYFTLLSKLRGDILAVAQEDDPNDIVSAYYSNVGGTQTLHLVKADGSEVIASQPQQVISGTLNYVSKFTSANDIGDSQIFDDGTNVGIGTTSMTHKLQLGTGGVFADYFQLDTTYSNGFVVGAISWDQDNGTADVGLSGSLKLKVGQDDVWYVKNQTGSTITKGTAVYANGTLGASSRITVAPMIADGTIPARFFLGIVAENIINGADGYVLARGKIRQISTLAYNEGDVLWVSPTTAGALTATEPTAPNLKLPVAFVVYKASNGVLAVRATTGTKIADASDVDYTGAVDNSFLVYNSATGIWEDEAIGIFKTIAVSGQTSVIADTYDDTLTFAAGTNVTITTDPGTDTITINSTDQFVGTVTSVATTAPITGGTITTTGTIGITQSGAATDGYLSSTDWNTFNNKEPSLTKGNLTEATSSVLTITGGTNAVIGTGTTIQVSQAGASSSGYLSSTDWNTFNGKASNSFTTIAVATQSSIVADTATDTLTVAAGSGVTITTDALTDTLTISATGSGGTVTSVDLTAGTGISVSGGPITTSGSITVTNTAPDQTVVLTAGTGITTSGTYPNFTVTNSAPDQVVSLTGAGTTSISGTYPNFTITSNDQYDGTVTSVDLTAGTGISVSGGPITSSGSITVTNTAPDQTVVLTAGTGISTSGTYPNFTITNSAPDQVVALTASTGISVTGTYPNFTITNTSPSSGGTITGSGTTNYLSKWTSGTALGDSLVFDNGTNVGIGTATPGTKLHVEGNISAGIGYNGGFYANADASTIDLNWGLDFSKSPSVSDYATRVKFYSSPGTSIKLGFWDSRTSSYMGYFDGGLSVPNFIIPSGNVGIGTTAPYQSKLHVTKSESGATPTAVLRIGNQGAGYTSRIILTDETTNDANISYLGATQSLGFGLGTSLSQMVLTSAGNVGIGTTSIPNAISGTETILKISNSNIASLYFESTGAGGFANYLNSARNLVWYDLTANAERMRITSAGNVGINSTAASVFVLDVFSKDTAYNTRLYQPSTATDTYVSLIVSGAMTSAIGYLGAGGSTTGNPSFRDNVVVGSQSNHPLVLNTNDAERMRITSAGNVGIGNTNPTAKLQVGADVHPSATGIEVAAGASGANLLALDSSTNHNWFPFTDGSNYYSAVSHTFRNELHSTDWMKITAAGNVGIGTTAPKSKLQIIGPTLTTNNENSYAVWVSDTGDDTKGLLLGYDLVNDVGVIQAVDQATSWKNISIASNGGNVSIGTTTNSGARTNIFLSEAGATPNAILRLQNTGSQYLAKMILTDGTTNDAVIGYQGGVTSATQYLGFGIGTSITQMILNASGNVGIGTTAPTMYGGRGMEVSGAGQTGIRISDTAGGGKVEIGSDSSGGYIQTAVAGNALTFYTGNASTLVMRMTSAGNVGIGTTAPSQKLHVVGNTYITDTLTVDCSSGNTLVLRKGTGAGALALAGTSDQASALIEGVSGGGLNIYTSNGGTLGTPGWSSKMYITAAGNVGIGTTAPGQRVDVVGVSSADTYLRVLGGAGATKGGIIIGNNDSGKNYGSLFFDNANNNVYLYQQYSAGDLILGTNTNEKMRITSAGNVGIGTTAPAQKLDVRGFVVSDSQSNGSESAFYLGNSAHGLSRANLANDVTLYTTAGDVKLSANTASVTHLIVKNSGNVGIGTTAPVARLQVASPTNAVDVLRIGNTAGDSGSVQGVTHLAINHFNAGTNPSTRITAYQDGVSGWPGGMYFSTRSLNTDSAPVERMRITSGGNVGIGTTSPSNILHITDVMRMDNVSAYSPNLSEASAPKYGYGDVSNERYLAEPVIWLKINVDGTEYVIPGYTEVI